MNLRRLLIKPYAYRKCGNDGQWLWDNWTNYTECIQYLAPVVVPTVHLLVCYILFIFSIISLALLLATLFIYLYFTSLMCSRLRVHRNLVVALIMHSILMIVISYPSIFSINSYRDIETLCKIVISLKLFAALSSINWMFIEGLLLHSRITTSIFRKDAPFKLYYCIGWGLPLLTTIIWCITMSYCWTSYCWTGYGDSIYVWIITGPMIAAIGINCIFLINIIRILVTKLRLTVNVETTQIRKAIKATALLFPLLGISHLLFCFNPGDNGNLENAYMITNAFLQSSQGMFVSILYCFLNTEVQTTLRNVYLRASIRRSANPNLRFSLIGRHSSNSSIH
ncbi:corticotropin-releasing factor receptor 1-like [Oppia nitens]|uniref:corticotropin-releasing factor receptor 1-like n=1 Tax=Oppia nitens TaxID=1686743 RepID=UPI0023DC2EAE|nr:corticotropin-releasing factor receptor 1-like [Oppia nitens]